METPKTEQQKSSAPLNGALAEIVTSPHGQKASIILAHSDPESIQSALNSVHPCCRRQIKCLDLQEQW